MRALIFDLDGTLIDTVYTHVFAWQRALAEAGMAIDGWRIRRRIGMSGRLCTRAVARELGHDISQQEGEVLQRCHVELFIRLLLDRRPCPVSAIGMAKCYVVSLGGSVSPDRGVGLC